MDWLSLGIWLLVGCAVAIGMVKRERERDRRDAELSERRRAVFWIGEDGVAHSRFTSMCSLATYLEEYAADIRRHVHVTPSGQGQGGGEQDG